MKKFKLAIIASILVTEIASASSSCEGFQIRLKNNLVDDLLVTTIKLNGAEIQPGTFEKLNHKSEQVFTINRTNQDLPMTGEFTLHTISLPSKTVIIQYTLENKVAYCEHTDNSPKSDYAVEKNRKMGEVQYTIKNQ
ncbi:hypothetical protein [Legionella parisiensis]|uniref:Uncharacterized protein n=1 Tax=Legionella parisiensis TaxID=45071 RepID=A0A1E5JWZ1_9GAMM|nr:hypothetical protein [Legionella parisiensis]KTD42224.1 hypothetical protein Lpar_3541 [Legionella parisiensis]OEH48893.1 hypothetical protein lpari_00038 [Legionella parisiensis]STX72291.1 Uncharacterised protein [Legionella parisiensis]